MLVFRLPSLDEKDTVSKKSLESVLTLMHYATGVKPDNMLYQTDKELGTNLHFESVHNNLIDELSSSASLPSGAFPSEIVTLGDYKGNLPTFLASVSLLNRRQNFLRKRSQKKDKVHVVTSNELRDTFNRRAGLSDKSKSYPIMLLKACLAVICSVRNKHLPGGWVSSNRSINNVKSDTGLIYKLGYTELVPYDHKLQAIIDHDVTVNPKGTKILRKKAQRNECNFLEFRAGTVLTSPRLNKASTEEPKVQMRREPMSIKDDIVLDNFRDNKYYKVIDSLDKTHAIMLSVTKGNSKTKAVHYEIARNEFLHMCAHLPIKDGSGVEHSSISSLPKPILDFCQKTYCFKLKTKRTSDEATSGDRMEVDDNSTTKKAKSAVEKSTSKSGSSKSTAPLKRTPALKKK